MSDPQPTQPVKPLQVILPVYNEGSVLGDLITRLSDVLSSTSHLLIVVDDGSTDEGVNTLPSQDNIMVIRHEKNKGLGEAIKTGLLTALANTPNGEGVVIVMDADNTQPPELIPRMLAEIESGFDVVIASRFKNEAVVQGVTVFRQLMSHGASWLFRLFLPIKNVKDYTCGYRVYRLKLVKEAFETFHGDLVTESGFTCMADILLKLHRMGASMTEVPLILQYDRKRSVSKMKVIATVLRSLQLIARHSFKP